MPIKYHIKSTEKFVNRTHMGLSCAELSNNPDYLMVSTLT